MGTTVVEPPPLSPTFNKRLIQVAACFSLQLPTIPCTWMLRREGRVVQGWSRRYLRATALCICICNCICICICVGIGVGISTCRQGHCLEGFCVCVPSPNLPEDPSIFIFLHLLLILKKPTMFSGICSTLIIAGEKVWVALMLVQRNYGM